jgi:hypothetical protein
MIGSVVGHLGRNVAATIGLLAVAPPSARRRRRSALGSASSSTRARCSSRPVVYADSDDETLDRALDDAISI